MLHGCRMWNSLLAPFWYIHPHSQEFCSIPVTHLLCPRLRQKPGSQTVWFSYAEQLPLQSVLEYKIANTLTSIQFSSQHWSLQAKDSSLSGYWPSCQLAIEKANGSEKAGSGERQDQQCLKNIYIDQRELFFLFRNWWNPARHQMQKGSDTSDDFCSEPGHETGRKY